MGDSSSDTDDDLLVLGLAVAAAVANDGNTVRKKRKLSDRRFYMHPENVKRPSDSYYLKLTMRLDEMVEEDYKYNLRVSKTEFQDLLGMVQDRLIHPTTHRFPISAGERLAMTLRFLGHGDSISAVALLFNVGETTASKIVYETCQVLWDILQPKVLPVPSEDDWKNIAAEFYEKCDFPLCLGAVDGKHIVLQGPRKSGSAYFNYKNSHSIILMAVADSNYRFVFVDIGAFGRSGDAGVFGRSAIGRGINDDTNPLLLPNNGNLPESNETFPYVFIGDAAFPIGPHLLRPFSGASLPITKRIFNYRLSRARRCVEQAFGIMANRWRIFRKAIHAEPDNAVLITKAAVVLHNYMGVQDEPVPEEKPLNRGDEEPVGGNRVAVGNYLRERLANWFSSKEGHARVPWQEEHARRGE